MVITKSTTTSGLATQDELQQLNSNYACPRWTYANDESGYYLILSRIGGETGFPVYDVDTAKAAGFATASGHYTESETGTLPIINSNPAPTQVSGTG